MKEMVFNLLVVSVMGTICFFCFVFFNLFSEEKLQRKELTIPTIKLEINNNKVDTIYIYIVK